MTDHKFTDEEIKMGLRCLSGEIILCKFCAFSRLEDHGFACKKNVSNAALDLINRQKNALEREIYNGLKADEEIEHLKVELDAMRGAANSYKMHYETAKSEAIKEFAERLIDKCTAPHWCVWMSEIEDLVTEMTENKR